MKKTVLVIILFCFPYTIIAGIDFDGTDDKLPCGDNGSLDFGTGSFTYSLWVFVSTSASSFDMSWNKGGASATNTGYDMELGTGAWKANISDGTTLFSANFSGTEINDVWVHLLAVVDQTDDELRAYKDGVLQSTKSITGIGSTSNATVAVIGNRSVGGFAFKGLINDVSIWGIELTDGEISLLADSKMKGMAYQIQSSSLKAYWPLDDEEDSSSGDGDTFVDRSGNGNTCTGDDGANNTGLTAKAEEILSYQ